MKTPLFSIIIATFNAGQTLAKAIRSVLSQDWNDLELIITDGGSTDETRDIVKSFGTSDPRIRFFSEPDTGVYDALNKGINHATGEWLYFLGADDYLYDDRVLHTVAATTRHTTAEIIYGNVFYQAYNRIYDGKFSIAKLLTRNVCHQSVFYKATLFNRFGSYKLGYKTEADYDFNLRCWLSGVQTIFLPTLVAFYSEGGKSALVRDARLVSDYPINTSYYLLTGNLSKVELIINLATVFRKILLRYSPAMLLQVIRRRGYYAQKLMALTWMLLTLPFYFLASLFSRNE